LFNPSEETFEPFETFERLEPRVIAEEETPALLGKMKLAQ
jgi:hypothetical protein